MINVCYNCNIANILHPFPLFNLKFILFYYPFAKGEIK
ncbi:hypothetical protein NitYY0826_C2042 [Nitratiruptor sp. YY08-26]|nr:hypothetical protein NitYY0813_C2040 [Nitratiruptor sp. YY08-13]BCD67083.1 hypothetical protein NitYY0826_C2042 [Nitratiruptor sp. YY08-26]